MVNVLSLCPVDIGQLLWRKEHGKASTWNCPPSHPESSVYSHDPLASHEMAPLVCFHDLCLRAAGAYDAFGPFSKDSGLASVDSLAEGLSRTLQAPLKRSLGGRKERGAEVGSKLSLGKGGPGAARPAICPHSLSPSRRSAQRLPGTQWVPCSNDAQ